MKRITDSRKLRNKNKIKWGQIYFRSRAVPELSLIPLDVKSYNTEVRQRKLIGTLLIAQTVA